MTRQELYAEIAAALRLGKPRPDLADALEALPRPGPKPHAKPSDQLEWAADIWEEIDDDITDGKSEVQALADAEQRTGRSETFIYNLWHLIGRDDVKPILRKRGRIR